MEGNFYVINDEMSTDEVKEKFEKCIKMRSEMSGSMYWNMFNNDAVMIANELRKRNVDIAYIESKLGIGNFY